MIQEAAAKASSEQNENPGVERNPSGTVNHSGDECGNENRQKSVRGKKRAREGSENVKHGRAKTGRGGGGGVSRARSGRGKQSNVEAVTLFEVVTMGRSAMQAVVDDWIEAYESDRDSALLDLISFFFQCSGCKGVVTAEMCQNRQDSEVISKMVESLDEDAGLQYKKFLAFPWILTVTWPMDIDNVEYPLVQPGPYGRWFHIEFCDFVSVLVSQCQHSVIFENYLMSILISLLTELSDSCVRAFRHTCTLAAVKLVSSLVGVALSLSVGVENSQKMYDVEKTKTTGRQRTLQLGRIQKKIKELRNKRVEIENVMDTIFKGVFLKRYRDVLPDIRSICMEELGVWMKLYSTAFLNDSYLKYMGWMLNDRQPEVRLKCVLGLQGLYGDPVLLSKLDLFSSRFKDRMMSMTLDKDNEVAVQTIKLLVLISKTCGEVLSPEDYKQLFQFVYSSHRLLATSAGEILYSRLLNVSSPTPEAEDGGNEYDAHTLQTTTKLMALLRFYQDSELHQHVVYLVDSLWDCAGALLKDWSTITSILLQDPTPDNTGPLVLTAAEQAVVVEILVASVRQASEGPVLVGRSGAKKVMSAKEKKTQMDDCSKITEHFLSVLPKMLSKFSHSSDMVASLMRIPHYFLPECPATENTQMVLDLLAKMGAVADLHTNPGVLEAAARSYQSLCGEEKAWHLTASAARDSLAQSWVDRLAPLLEVSLTDGTFSADEEKTGCILATLKKLCAFHNAQDLKLKLFELLTPLFSAESTWGGVPPEILLESLRCLCFSMLWNLNTSGVTLTSREKAVAQRTQLSVFCEKSYRCLTHVNMDVREQAFLGLCDILTAHNYQLHVFEPTSFGPLCYTPNPKLQRALSTFTLDQVFISPDGNGQIGGSEVEEKKLEELHRRRNLLAAYSKLIVHGVLEMSMAAGIYSFYMKHYNDFGDIIKETLYRTRQTDKIQSAHTLVLCLQQLFVRLKQEQQSGGGGANNPAVQTFTSIKELARRFALTFGDLVKYRESVAMIHTSGIEFVFHGFVQTPDRLSPPYLSYLAILSEFSSKLLKPDKKTVLTYLQKLTGEHILSPKEDFWQPLIYYRASLLAVADGEDASSYVSFDKRPYLRQNLLLDGSKSPGPISTVSKGSKAPKAPKHAVGSRSSSLRSVSNPPEKIDRMDPSCPVTTEPPATQERVDITATSTDEDEVDVDTIEVDV